MTGVSLSNNKNDAHLLELFSQNRVKDIILHNLSKAYREICLKCIQAPDLPLTDDVTTNLITSCIEAFFLHRIRPKGAKKLANFLSGSTIVSPLPSNSPNAVNFWHFLRVYLPKNALDNIKSSLRTASDIGHCRVWVRSCINEGSVSSYVSSILQDHERICNYYHLNALILDLERRYVLLEILRSLDEIRFHLNISSSLLNLWTSSSVHQLLIPPNDSGQQLLSLRRQASFQTSQEQSSYVSPQFASLVRRNQIGNRSRSATEQTVLDANQKQDVEFKAIEERIMRSALADIKREVDGIKKQAVLLSENHRRQNLEGAVVVTRKHSEYTLTSSINRNSNLGELVKADGNWSAPPCEMEDNNRTVTTDVIAAVTIGDDIRRNNDSACLNDDQSQAVVCDKENDQSEGFAIDTNEMTLSNPQLVLAHNLAGPSGGGVYSSSAPVTSLDSELMTAGTVCIADNDSEHSSDHTSKGDAVSETLDWVILGDDLLMQNNPGFQDLLDLFPGVSEVAPLSSVSCPSCLTTLNLLQPSNAGSQHSTSSEQNDTAAASSSHDYPLTDRYDGKLYCYSCCPHLHPCPRDIICNWDFTPYPMSVNSFHALELIWSHPMIDLAKSNSKLYDIHKELHDILQLRRQLLVLWRYLSSCQPATVTATFRSVMAGLEYMYDSRMTLHLYSPADLCSINNGQLKQRLLRAVEPAKAHVAFCQDCLRSTTRCWSCKRQEKPILLYDLDSYRECVSLNCTSVCHLECADSARCSRCETLQKLALDSLRFDLPDS